jgi:putative redox protein
MNYEVTFPGGLVVEATYGIHTIRTDQPVKDGGTDTAMSPSALLWASMATCMGFYALRFCQQRNLSVEGLGLSLTPVRDPESGRIADVRIEVRLPKGFPEKYHDALLRSVDHCSVKRTILEPPHFAIALAPAVAVS